MNDLLRGIEQTSGRIELDHQTLRVVRPSLIDTARNVAGRRRPNGSVNIDVGDLFRCECYRGNRTRDAENPDRNENGGAISASPHSACAPAISPSGSQSSALHRFTTRRVTMRKLTLLSSAEA